MLVIVYTLPQRGGGEMQNVIWSIGQQGYLTHSTTEFAPTIDGAWKMCEEELRQVVNDRNLEVTVRISS